MVKCFCFQLPFPAVGCNTNKSKNLHETIIPIFLFRIMLRKRKPHLPWPLLHYHPIMATVGGQDQLVGLVAQPQLPLPSQYQIQRPRLPSRWPMMIGAGPMTHLRQIDTKMHPLMIPGVSMQHQIILTTIIIRQVQVPILSILLINRLSKNLPQLLQ